MPEKGRLFCERVPFPEASLFLDPERVAYRELSLYEGLGRTFFSRATPKVQPASNASGIIHSLTPEFPASLLKLSRSIGSRQRPSAEVAHHLESLR